MTLDPRLLRAVRHVEARLDDPEADLSLGALARAAAMSPFHFARWFQASLGEAPAAWVRRVRLERAASLLRHSDLPVGRVAQGAGYSTQAAFTRAFTRRFGEAPAAWRDRQGVAPWLLPPGARSPRRHVGVDTVELPPRRLVVARHVGAFEQLGGAVDAVCRLGDVLEIGPEGWLVLVFLDDDEVVDPAMSRVDLGWETDRPAPEGFAVRQLVGGEHAVAGLAGGLDEVLVQASSLLYSRLPESGLQPAAFETVVELPAAVAWRARDDLMGTLAGTFVGRVLHPVGPPGALVRG